MHYHPEFCVQFLPRNYKKLVTLHCSFHVLSLCNYKTCIHSSEQKFTWRIDIAQYWQHLSKQMFLKLQIQKGKIFLIFSKSYFMLCWLSDKHQSIVLVLCVLKRSNQKRVQLMTTTLLVRFRSTFNPIPR